jgi:hypothetical protein
MHTLGGSVILAQEDALTRNSKILTLVIFVLVLLSPCVSPGQNHVVIGNDDGDGLLFSPRQVEEGPDGNIYVLDTGDAFIKVFSADGEYLRRIGGEGEGPGEFQRADASSFGFTPDGKLNFAEYLGGHRWITLMELSGDLDRVLSPRIEAEVFGISRAVALEEGGLLVQIAYSAMPEAKADYYLYRRTRTLVRIDANGNVLSEVVEASYIDNISFVGSGGTESLPYTPVFAWAPSEDGTVAYSDGMSGILKVFDFDGKLVREIETDLPEPEKVTKEDLNSWRGKRKGYLTSTNPGHYQEFGRVIEKYTKSLYDKPNVDGISRTRDGNILVTLPWDSEEGKREYRLIGAYGKTLAAVRVVADRLRISKHYILFFRNDEEGNTLVHCVERTGSEEADLLAIGTLAGPE